jgi:hypothetical protein
MERIFGTLTQKTWLQTAMLLKTQTIITSLLSHSSFFGVGSVTRQNIYAVPFHFPSSKWILIAKQSGNLDAMPGLWAVSNV